MTPEKVKGYIRFKRPEYEEEVVDDVARLLIADDFPKNKITTMAGAIRFMDYAFALSTKETQ